MQLDEMLGFDKNDPEDRHAEILVEEHERLIEELVAWRRAYGLEQKDVAAAMGIDASGVSRIESGDRDLHMSTLRRYSFAVGCVIHHEVVPYASFTHRECYADLKRSAQVLFTTGDTETSWWDQDDDLAQRSVRELLR